MNFNTFGKLLVSLRGSYCKRAFSNATLQRPRRSVLFVPGSDERKVKKATTLNADCIVLDCEDGVALNRKDEARNNVASCLGTLDFGKSEFAIRINCLGSDFATEDLSAILSSKALPECIMVPKVENCEQVKRLSTEMAGHLQMRQHNNQKIPVILMIENAIGLLNMRDICEEAILTHHPFSVQAFVIGTDDFLASIGGMRTQDAKELLFARQYFVTHCKAFELQAIDMVHIDFKDLESLRFHAEEGAKMGFTGKQIIHPGQIDTVNRAFLPSEEKVEWAEELIKAFDNHQLSGKGAFSFRGSMIDMPSLKQAKNLVNVMQMIKDR